MAPRGGRPGQRKILVSCYGALVLVSGALVLACSRPAGGIAARENIWFSCFRALVMVSGALVLVSGVLAIVFGALVIVSGALVLAPHGGLGFLLKHNFPTNFVHVSQ